jgi:methionyl-tRNA synthetase
MERYAFQNALSLIFKVTSRANKYIDETAPWVLAKDEANRARLAAVMYNLLETIRICTVLLQPFMPGTCVEIFNQIGAGEALRTWDSVAAFGALPADVTVRKGPAVFPRIDMAKELAELENLTKND